MLRFDQINAQLKGSAFRNSAEFDESSGGDEDEGGDGENGNASVAPPRVGAGGVVSDASDGIIDLDADDSPEMSAGFSGNYDPRDGGYGGGGEGGVETGQGGAPYYRGGGGGGGASNGPFGQSQGSTGTSGPRGRGRGGRGEGGGFAAELDPKNMVSGNYLFHIIILGRFLFLTCFFHSCINRKMCKGEQCIRLVEGWEGARNSWGCTCFIPYSS